MIIISFITSTNSFTLLFSFSYRRVLEKKLSAWLSVRRVKRTFPTENIEISFYVLIDGSIESERLGGGEISLPLPAGSKKHTFGIKKTFIEMSKFPFSRGTKVRWWTRRSYRGHKNTFHKVRLFTTVSSGK